MAGYRSVCIVILGMTASAQAAENWPVYYVPSYGYYPYYPACSTILAPPKKTGEINPGLGSTIKKGPTVTESRSKTGGYAEAGTTKERCKVGFWNVTGRDVTLKIDGQPRLLPKDRAVTLDLDRSFAWQIDQGESVIENVPEEQGFFEVILRQ